MKVSAERIDNNKMILEMEVPEAEVMKAFDKAYRKLADRVNIPGFRRGKAPRRVLEMRLGKEMLREEAFDVLVPDAYARAIREQNIEPVSQPEIEVIKFDEGAPLVFKATIITKPEVKLGQYKGLAVVRPDQQISDADVSDYLENLRQRRARLVVAEDAALQEGDLALIDFYGTIDGEPFEGGEGKSYPLEIGSGHFLPGFEDQLVGARAGEERIVNVTFPADYHVAELAGKEAVFTVKVTDVKRREIPDLDDDFARDVSEFSSLEELRADVRNKLEKNLKLQSERQFRESAVKAAVDNAMVDIPDVMVEKRIDTMIDDLDISLQSRGLTLDQYLTHTKSDRSALRDQYREAAIQSVKVDLVLEAVAKAEGLAAEPADIEAEILRMAKVYNATPDVVRKIVNAEGRKASLIESILRKKAADFIADNAVATEAPQEGVRQEESDGNSSAGGK